MDRKMLATHTTSPDCTGQR
uniref:Uncharacterized protein n=1 Tax=Rhizophora mucronata TaxID=61149 RepID=A0A2P2M768_RHIMU